MKIDKSVFTPEELAQYEALIAKAKVDPEADPEEAGLTDGELSTPPKKKPQENPEGDGPEEKAPEDNVGKKDTSPEMSAALKRLETLEKSIQMKEYTEIAKKYAPLGENVEELAKSLYGMKQTGQENYDAYLSVLVKSLDLVNKSGVFAEIGKSVAGVGDDVLAKVEAAADDIQKSDTSLDRVQAVAKAWENHPELVAEYERAYQA